MNGEMPSKRTHMQVLDNFADCDLDPDMEPLSPLPETPSLPETPIQDENTDTGGKKSFVWRYFKAATVDGVLSNVCQYVESLGSQTSDIRQEDGNWRNHQSLAQRRHPQDTHSRLVDCISGSILCYLQRSFPHRGG
ncbi:hypothetical protein Pst134EA_002711 [Puccinia striiformis f. sp. tritici]|uniref:hypothetical protein n=1 Tax=Puccinia striiformis f. sp. tritici TaxID=168172 RepID=UPI0020085B86|nr:hypothetical protein Pst134EA_002711 [Puccinia striiformis f. sp. tritici]KAH9472085.1 hypothetical protein Pst134EA_002711 [Puccinia striiformis f. sp. tritici]